MSADFKHEDPFHRLTIGALGVVFGDIGTSPLYTLKECFNVSESLALSTVNILGILSFIFWSITIVISVKYVTLIMRADNNGEGGILALMALALRKSGLGTRKKIILAGIFGAGLFFGDGVITPAISVLSALEGLTVATPALSSHVLPLSVIILMVVFWVQKRGTSGIGQLFGPIMTLWFICIGILGFVQIIKNPVVLHALNPYYAIYFLWHEQGIAFIMLGAVFLALTGAEALYADMGHFGKSPIRYAWFFLVFPALILNYFGQGAVVLRYPEAIQNPFYHLVPMWCLYPLIIFATIATIIASQAVISGTFSLSRQAIRLGYLPRFKILHTSARKIGQVYVPHVNRWLMILVIAIVLEFQTSDALASAYGLAVSGIMIITTLLTFFVARRFWGWSYLKIGLIFGGFLMLDSVFFLSNLLKITEGGWISMTVAVAVYIIMSTWKEGREILLYQVRRSSITISSFIEDLKVKKPLRVPGTAIFMSGSRDIVPYSLLINLKHNKVLHEQVVILTIITKDVPYVPKSQRIQVELLDESFYRITAFYGFKQTPNVLRILEQTAKKGLIFNIMETTFFLSRGLPVMTMHHHISRWREKLFIYLSRNAASAVDSFTVPHQRVIELRVQVKISGLWS